MSLSRWLCFFLSFESGFSSINAFLTCVSSNAHSHTYPTRRLICHSNSKTGKQKVKKTATEKQKMTHSLFPAVHRIPTAKQLKDTFLRDYCCRGFGVLVADYRCLVGLGGFLFLPYPLYYGCVQLKKRIKRCWRNTTLSVTAHNVWGASPHSSSEVERGANFFSLSWRFLFFFRWVEW